MDNISGLVQVKLRERARIGGTVLTISLWPSLQVVSSNRHPVPQEIIDACNNWATNDYGMTLTRYLNKVFKDSIHSY